jgi:hypothetical protein
LFLRDDKVTIYLTQREQNYDDFLSRLHAYGMGTNKLYLQDHRRSRSVNVDQDPTRDEISENSKSVSLNDGMDPNYDA